MKVAGIYSYVLAQPLTNCSTFQGHVFI